MISDPAFRIAYALRTNPWLRIVLGVVLIGAGALEVLTGAGHGRLIGLGLLLLGGAPAATRELGPPGNRDGFGAS